MGLAAQSKKIRCNINYPKFLLLHTDLSLINQYNYNILASLGNVGAYDTCRFMVSVDIVIGDVWFYICIIISFQGYCFKNFTCLRYFSRNQSLKVTLFYSYLAQRSLVFIRKGLIKLIFGGNKLKVHRSFPQSQVNSQPFGYRYNFVSIQPKIVVYVGIRFFLSLLELWGGLYVRMYVATSLKKSGKFRPVGSYYPVKPDVERNAETKSFIPH